MELARYLKEMNNRIGRIAKLVWNVLSNYFDMP